MLSTTRIFPKTPRLKNHRPKFSRIFIHTDPSDAPTQCFHSKMRASDSRCVETNAQGARGEFVVRASRLHVQPGWPHHKHVQPGWPHHKQSARPRIAVGDFVVPSLPPHLARRTIAQSALRF
jgi:hypothetical protein